LFKPGTQFEVERVIDGVGGANTEIFLKEIIK